MIGDRNNLGHERCSLANGHSASVLKRDCFQSPHDHEGSYVVRDGTALGVMNDPRAEESASVSFGWMGHRISDHGELACAATTLCASVRVSSPNQ